MPFQCRNNFPNQQLFRLQHWVSWHLHFLFGRKSILFLFSIKIKLQAAIICSGCKAIVSKITLRNSQAPTIYFDNTVPHESPKKANVFINNTADIFANDFLTFPIRAVYVNETEKKQPGFRIFRNLVPGISALNITFVIVDYYGQIFKSLNANYSSLEISNTKKVNLGILPYTRCRTGTLCFKNDRFHS